MLLFYTVYSYFLVQISYTITLRPQKIQLPGIFSRYESAFILYQTKYVREDSFYICFHVC